MGGRTIPIWKHFLETGIFSIFHISLSPKQSLSSAWLAKCRLWDHFPSNHSFNRLPLPLLIAIYFEDLLASSGPYRCLPLLSLRWDTNALILTDWFLLAEVCWWCREPTTGLYISESVEIWILVWAWHGRNEITAGLVFKIIHASRRGNFTGAENVAPHSLLQTGVTQRSCINESRRKGPLNLTINQCGVSHQFC